jgi:Fe-S oxidoreductase
MAKNEDDIARAKELSREFIRENFRQAESLGAKSLVLFCAACEPNYANLRDDTRLEVISFSDLLDRHFAAGRLNAEVDYYAGCYRFRRRITSLPVDVSAALRLLGKIEGLKVNEVDNSLCCYVPVHLERLTEGLKASTLVTICSGCYYNLRGRLQQRPGVEVKMLPEVLWQSLQG